MSTLYPKKRKKVVPIKCVRCGRFVSYDSIHNGDVTIKSNDGGQTVYYEHKKECV